MNEVLDYFKNERTKSPEDLDREIVLVVESLSEKIRQLASDGLSNESFTGVPLGPGGDLEKLERFRKLVESGFWKKVFSDLKIDIKRNSILGGLNTPLFALAVGYGAAQMANDPKSAALGALLISAMETITTAYQSIAGNIAHYNIERRQVEVILEKNLE